MISLSATESEIVMICVKESELWVRRRKVEIRINKYEQNENY